ncbi:type II secretion system secretin GspD [Motiliproteus sp. MSK22-1]|uniref:type II secretion system secretin GspD n=1 Tax=Motiliproteus sp. MSK22-1 TaxID=1897630 RepID=UPI000975C8FA|nr:type II secretion system secretin GspD [Motiliproteus sp. MSK22-1]OMH34793.1 type II secretion system protein GspD [Motiliproteus sp. MSK22-1]
MSLKPLCTLLLSCFLVWSLSSHAEEFTLDMRDTDIREFIATVGKLSGKTIIVDQRVKGRVNIQSPKPVSAAEFYEIFLVQLGVSGYSVVDLGNNILKVIPKQAAKLEGIGVEGEDNNVPPPSEEIITRVVQVTNVEVNQLVPILRPLVDNKSGIIAPYAASNVILITDKKSNVRRLLEIIARVDKADTDSMEVIKLNNASAKEMSRILTSLIREQAKGQQVARAIPVITADERTNSLLIRGDSQSRAYLKKIIQRLDSEVKTATNTKVVYLKYAKAEELATLLESVSDSMIKTEQSQSLDQNPTAKRLNVHIKAHEQTNAIVLSGSSLIIEELEAVVKQLDIRRAQVLVEAIIVEITENRAKELGVQWLFRGDPDSSGLVGGATNFKNLGNSLLGAASSTDGGDSVADALAGVEGISLGLGRISSSGLSFAALIKAFSGDSNSNVLSTPVLMTMDNEEASIHVGQNVPILTGSTASDNNGNPFQTIEREDIGIKLGVQPQINEGNTVQLKIEQEVSSLTGLTASDIIINKRVIDTTVMIENGATIVLGGLVDDDIQQDSDKVPLLGDLPGIGRAFKSDKSKRVRRNLMVFIRPTIIRDSETMIEISSRKYLYIKAQQMLQENGGINLFPEDSKPLALPEWTGMGPASAHLFGPE